MLLAQDLTSMEALMPESPRFRGPVSPEDLLGPLNEVETKNAPPQLWIAGSADVLTAGPRVSIVGARNASPEGLRRAARLARLLVDHGVTVVSGLAKGVDAAAHKAAIEANGRTIGVIGTPLDQVYPAENRELQHRMMREQLVISQFAPGERVFRSNFPQRNKTMALVVDASVIVEASDSSGSLSQGWEALRLGRPLFMMKSVAENATLTWPAKMRPYGAQVLSDSNFDLLFEALPVWARETADALPF